MARVKLEFILFGVLMQKPQTGYELQQFMETSGRFMRTNTSMTQVYRSLRSMETDGLLTFDVEPRLGAQDAKRYRPTPAGETVFLDWLRQPYTPHDFTDDPDFFVRLRFRSQYLGRAATIEMLDIDIEHRRRQIARNRLRDRTEFFDPRAPIDVELAGAIINWEHHRGADRMDAHLEACTALRESLSTGELPCDGEPNPLLPVPDTLDPNVVRPS